VKTLTAGARRGFVRFAFRHRVAQLSVNAGAVEPAPVLRGAPSSRTPIGSFEFRAQAVIVASGGIGANHDLVRANWPQRLGAPPKRMLSGLPGHVDGRMLAICEGTGAR
jgi:uncharacterized protein